jgi:2-hydroxychromene-2-carboxylate isomerase
VTIDWYFDFISPFAYFQWRRLRELPAGAVLRLRPVLLAGILKHWGQLGPAEIAPKRLFTYRHATWIAARDGVPFTMPAGHPFNSLPLLRLAWALGASPAVVDRLFRFVWVDGHIPQEAGPWQRLRAELGAAADSESPAVKEQLRSATDAAIAAGVFGVPTAIVDGELFWGYEATELLFEFCRDPAVLRSEAMRRAAAVPVAAARLTAGAGATPVR